MRNPLLVALDVPNAEAALKLAEQLSGAVGGFKVGSELFTAAGPELVRRLRASGAQVFLDLKFHDIPNTVAKAVASATRLDVQMITIHASGGSEMMRAAQEAAEATSREAGLRCPLVLGVTVLTSVDSKTLKEIGIADSPEQQVLKLARLAVVAGLKGLVCSPLEIAPLRAALPKEVQLITPGIRSQPAKGDDQKRTLSAREAMQAGASWLVIGRPVYADPNPRAAAEAILKTIA
jgi:orotidine-5'-phosphate decarboxylase